MKAVMRGKLISRQSHYKKIRRELYWTKINELKSLEHDYKNMKDPNTEKRIGEVKKEINEVLEDEVEKKSRFIKQTYYEGGSKATKLLAKWIKRQEIIR